MTLSIKKNTIVLSLCLLILIVQNIVYLEEIAVMGFMISLLRILIFAIVCLLFIRKYNKLTKFEYSWLLLYLWWFIATLVVGTGAVIPIISYIIDSLFFIMLIKLYGREDPKNFLWVFSRILSFFIYLNFALLILKDGDGIWKDKSYYFLAGNYNGFGPIFIITYVVEILYVYQCKKMDWNLILLTPIMVGSLIYVGSMTSIVGLSILIVYSCILFAPFRRIILKCFFVFYLVFQTFVVFLRKDITEISSATYFIENVLQKNTTFTSRTIVWAGVEGYIKESPWIGYGFNSPEWYEDQFDVLTTHNKIYHFLLDGGSILLLLFFTCLIVVLRTSNQWKYTQEVCFVQFALCTLFFMMTMESYSNFYILILLTLLYYIKYFLPYDQLQYHYSTL